MDRLDRLVTAPGIKAVQVPGPGRHETQPPHADPHLHTRGCSGHNGHRTVTRLLPSDSWS